MAAGFELLKVDERFWKIIIDKWRHWILENYSKSRRKKWEWSNK